MIMLDTFYHRNNVNRCTRILGLHSSPNGVEYLGNLVSVGTFPIGIDPKKFIDVKLIIRDWRNQM